jgi:peptidoglycan/LPS O-acetylase OafA/YrhL
MFIVVALAAAFAAAGHAIWGVPVFFVAALACSGVVGEMVARWYSEPMNRRLRGRWGDGARRLGSVVEETAVGG